MKIVLLDPSPRPLFLLYETLSLLFGPQTVSESINETPQERNDTPQEISKSRIRPIMNQRIGLDGHLEIL